MGATRERMVREFCEALEMITQEVALVVILEDLHRIDNSSLDILSAIARRREPAKFLLIGTFREADLLQSESPLKRLRQDLLSHGLAHELKLGDFSQSDVDKYLAAEFAGNSLPAEFVGLIHQRSEGNPLFITAMLDHLIRTGVLSEADGSWKLTVPVDRIDLDVPDSLRQMLDLQMAQLSISERRLLQCASVAGQTFTVCSIAVMLERSFQETEQACARLADKQFLTGGGTYELPSGVLTVWYEFRHSLYREALYRGLTSSERIKLHHTSETKNAGGEICVKSPHLP